MLITNNLEVIVKNNLRIYYKDLGYEFPSSWDPRIIIKIQDLPKSSNLKIECKCDICGKINNISYYHYNKNIKIGGFYSCKGKCSRFKFKSTCLERFGFENSFQNEEIKQKSKDTCMKKFGVNNSLKSLDIRKKVRETMTKNYENNFKNKYKIKKYKDTDVYYQGTYEFDFLEKYFPIGLKRCKTIKYVHNNEEKLYFPDFYYEPLNLIIEIKSEYTYKQHLEKNIEKEKSCIRQGFKYIKILDKNYSEFEKLLTSSNAHIVIF